MSGWTLRRFWKETVVVELPGGFGVALDGRPIRTPGKVALLLPTAALAQWIAEEWAAQEGEVRPLTMPATRTANSAVDKVTPQKAAVEAMLAGYGGTDLLCYRAERPEALVLRQAEGWDRWLDWAESRFGARLHTTRGVMPVAQEPAALSRLAQAVEAFDPFALAAFHDLVTLSGSLVLALAVAEGALEPGSGWQLSRLDEDWQAEQWGEDDEAMQAAGLKRADFLHAARFLSLCAAPQRPDPGPFSRPG